MMLDGRREEEEEGELGSLLLCLRWSSCRNDGEAREEALMLGHERDGTGRDLIGCWPGEGESPCRPGGRVGGEKGGAGASSQGRRVAPLRRALAMRSSLSEVAHKSEEKRRS